VKLRIADYASSMASDIDYFELRNDEYGLNAIGFAPGDVVIDIGGNVGQVAIYIAKKFPAVRIFSFEPVPENHDHYRRNLEYNGVTTVQLANLAVTGDGRDLSLTVNFDNNSGGGTAHVRDMEMARHNSCTAKSVTLDQVFEEHGIEKCKLLKIDCEGSEHEILMNATVLDRVEFLSGEFHINGQLSMRGYSIDALQQHCERFIEPSKIRIKRCHMAE
jgi:FkbM family methyltransferase